MTLQQLKVFVTVVELGSFSRAAESLRISQPAVSTHIRCLEEELGDKCHVRAASKHSVTVGEPCHELQQVSP